MLKRSRSNDWFENEAFWREAYAFMFPDSCIAEAADQMARTLALTAPSGKTVLDLCCGPGRCAVALAKQGLSVTGVDRTKYLLDKARARARKEGVSVKWVQEDMRNFVRKDSYDLALSMFTSFGYFESREEDSRVLKNIYTSLRPGGQVLLELLGKENLAKIFQPSLAETAPDGSILIQQPHILDGWSRVSNVWTVVRNGKARQFTIELNLYSGQELRARLELAGFEDVKLYGNLDGEPYGPEARRLIAVGRKPS
jgi:2-polyprenyl-3-methyl-5-hydroxy-6-metoxy-1,4-benzoquinol methylase